MCRIDSPGLFLFFVFLVLFPPPIATPLHHPLGMTCLCYLCGLVCLSVCLYFWLVSLSVSLSFSLRCVLTFCTLCFDFLQLHCSQAGGTSVARDHSSLSPYHVCVYNRCGGLDLFCLPDRREPGTEDPGIIGAPR